MKTTRILGKWLLLAVIVASFVAVSPAQIGVGISVRIGPPALPVYAQPICPGPGYMWTPGYWAWNDDGGYYWVPGTWVVAPIGLLWTPGYWGWGGGLYLWHAGYWGPHIGFYGGINYGFGYGGVGFAGGEWRGGAFFYNRSVTNVSVTSVTNVYNRTVVVNENHVAFNGGEGGIRAEPTAEERVAEHEQHTAPLASQTQQEHLAAQNHDNFASANHGRPAVAATARAGDFSSHSVVGARSAGGEYHAPAMSPKEARGPSNAGNHGGAEGGGKSNSGFRSFTPPNSSNTKNGSESNARSNYSENGSRNNSNPQKNNSNPPKNRPKSNSKPASKPHSSPPPKKAPKEQRSR
jgi:WXXGXW repeat (2 copies)